MNDNFAIFTSFSMIGLLEAELFQAYHHSRAIDYAFHFMFHIEETYPTPNWDAMCIWMSVVDSPRSIKECDVVALSLSPFIVWTTYLE